MNFPIIPKFVVLISILFLFANTSCDLDPSEDEPDLLTPRFSLTPSATPCKVPCQVSVDASSSEGATSYSWDFGDNSLEKVGVTATHTYDSVGTFTITLTATGSGGSSTITQTQTVADSTSPPSPNPPHADFEIDSISNNGFTPSTVFFRNTSSNADAYEWNFNDPTSGNSNTSTETNPSHTFLNSGIYQVRLTAKSSQTSTENFAQKEIVINETPTFSTTVSIGSNQGFNFNFARADGGNYVLAHNSGDLNTGELAIIDPSGNLLSSQSYTFFLRPSFQDIHPLPNGNVAVTGTLSGGFAPGSDILFLETDGTGNEVQKMNYNFTQFESGKAIVPLSGGGYALVGTDIDFDTFDGSVVLLRLDSEGNVLEDFPKYFPMGQSPDIKDIVELSNGNLAILGDYPNDATAIPGLIFIILTDSDGNELPGSPRIYQHDRFEGVGRLIETSSGGLAIVGSSCIWTGPTFDDCDILLILTDQNGNELPFSPKRINLGYEALGSGITLLPDGGFALTGHTFSAEGSLPDAFLLFTDANGNQVGQEKTFGAATRSDYGLNLLANPDGGFTILGYTQNVSDTHDALLIKTDANGEVK